MWAWRSRKDVHIHGSAGYYVLCPCIMHQYRLHPNCHAVAVVARVAVAGVAPAVLVAVVADGAALNKSTYGVPCAGLETGAIWR